MPLRATMRMLGRALRLRCPHCGGRPVLKDWFHLRERCPRCRLNLERGENDYFLGAYTLSLIAVETVFALGFLLVLVLTWPDPPWAAIQWGGAIVLTASVIGWYPFAKLLWLAIDLVFRPVAYKELGWHDEEGIE
jgi:uncharacterized protein (DUF983 family)